LTSTHPATIGGLCGGQKRGQRQGARGLQLGSGIVMVVATTFIGQTAVWRHDKAK